MEKFVIFILVGIFFATVGEFIVNVLILNSFSGYMSTFVIYTMLLVFAYFFGNFIGYIFRQDLPAHVIYYFISGFIGLAVEWLLLGNSPSANPDANQLGLFSFWAAVFMMPRIFTDDKADTGRLKKAAVLFFIPYSVVGIIAGLALPLSLKVLVFAWFISGGYIFMNVFYLWYFRKNMGATQRDGLMAALGR